MMSLRLVGRIARVPILLGMVLASGCATTERLSAAGDVRSLLVAVRDDDRAAFEAHVDRQALEARIQAAMVDRARAARLGAGGEGLSLLLSGPLARVAGDLVIRPDVLRAAADYYGYRPDTPIPGPLSLAAALSALPDGRVCARARSHAPCLLTFADQGGTWRLVDFDVDFMLAGHGPARRP